MFYRIKQIFTILLAFLMVSCTTNQAKMMHDSQSSYHVIFDLPKGWHKVAIFRDSGGYTMTYQSTKAINEKLKIPNIAINYQKNSQVSLSDTVKQIKEINQVAQCDYKKVQVLKQSHDTITFTATLDQCMNRRALKRIFKVFNKPDGQYTIAYYFNPNISSPTSYSKMKKIIVQSKLIKTH